MSLHLFEQALIAADVAQKRRTWWLHWVKLFARFADQGVNRRLSVGRDEVVRFLQSRRDQGKAAWQRLQAVQALQFYRTCVRHDAADELDDVGETLQRLAAAERRGAEGPCRERRAAMPWSP